MCLYLTIYFNKSRASVVRKNREKIEKLNNSLINTSGSTKPNKTF